MFRCNAIWVSLVLLCACEGASSPPAQTGSTGRVDAGDVFETDAGSMTELGPPSFSKEELEAIRALVLPVDAGPPADPSNAYTTGPKAELAAEFGQRLFFETRFSGPLLSADNSEANADFALGLQGDVHKVSCASCHVAEDRFIDTRTLHQQISLASDWVLRRTPTLLDVAQNKLFMWDGRRDALHNQPVGAFESHKEMNSSRLYVAQQVYRLHKAEYESIFGALPPMDDTERFPELSPANAGCTELAPGNVVCRGVPGDGSEFDGMSVADQNAVTEVMINVGKAIAAYERLLTCGRSRFDEWADGDSDALTEAELRGLEVFMGPGECVTCHSGPYFSDFGFHNVGLQPQTVAAVFTNIQDRGAAEGIAAAKLDPLNVNGEFSDGDDGRLNIHVDDSLLGAFKTPMLRCLDEQPSFMHTGHMSSIEEVIDFFDQGGDRYGFEGKSELQDDDGNRHQLGLTDTQKSDLAAFIRALSGPGPEARLLYSP